MALAELFAGLKKEGVLWEYERASLHLFREKIMNVDFCMEIEK